MSSDTATSAIRPVAEIDLPALRDVFLRALRHLLSAEGRASHADTLCPLVTSEARHILATDPDQQWLAEEDGVPVGFVSSITRGRVWFLANFWMLPAAQAAGRGRALLGRALAAGEARGARVRSVYASRHPSAQALYIRAGMTPRCPFYSCTLGTARAVEAADAAPPCPRDVTIRRAAAGEKNLAALVALDRMIRAVPRADDHRYWLARPTRTCLIAERGSAALGYAYVSRTGRIGPLGALETRLVPPLLSAALREAGALAAVQRAGGLRAAEEAADVPHAHVPPVDVRAADMRAADALAPHARVATPVPESEHEVFLSVPGSNMTALSWLLDRGFRIETSGILMTSEPFGLFDRYVVSGPGLL